MTDSYKSDRRNKQLLIRKETMMGNLMEKMSKGELGLMVSMKGGLNSIPSLQKAGFDCARADMMHGGIDWRDIDYLVKAAKSCGITSCVRLATNPWLAGENNMQLAVDAARAFALGVEIVKASIASLAQAKVLVESAKDWHRSGAGWWPSSEEDYSANMEKAGRNALACPSFESLTAIRDIDEILALPGLRMLALACTDLSEQMGHRFGYDHPEVLALVKSITTKARERGIVVCANVGYEARTAGEIASRVERLYDHGVRIVLMNSIEKLMYTFSSNMITGIRTSIGSRSQQTA
jgi:2-keto-3-deoxy-L-rhamnonate aldolase RhmA